MRAMDDDVQRERHRDRGHHPRRPEVAEAAARPDDGHDDRDEHGQREVHRERDVRIERARGARAGFGGGWHRPIMAAEHPLREPALHDSHATQREQAQRGARDGERDRRERRPQLVGAPQAEVGLARGQRPRPRGERRQPEGQRDQPQPDAPEGEAEHRMHDKPDEVAPRLAVAERRAQQCLQPAPRLAVARPHRPAQEPCGVAAVKLGGPAKGDREPDDHRQSDDEDDQRQRQREPGRPDAQRERAREDSEPEVRRVARGLRGNRADRAGRRHDSHDPKRDGQRHWGAAPSPKAPPPVDALRPAPGWDRRRSATPT